MIRFEYIKKKCHTLYILIFCTVGRQVREGVAYGCAVPRDYADRNPGLFVNLFIHIYFDETRV